MFTPVGGWEIRACGLVGRSFFFPEQTCQDGKRDERPLAVFLGYECVLLYWNANATTHCVHFLYLPEGSVMLSPLRRCRLPMNGTIGARPGYVDKDYQCIQPSMRCVGSLSGCKAVHIYIT